jgi:protein-L-isoaspartate O-methyltransferase
MAITSPGRQEESPVQNDPVLLTSESELLIYGTALHAAAREPDRLRFLVSKVADWTVVLSLAQRHGVLALLHAALRDGPRDLIPARVSEALGRWSTRESALRDRQLTALRRVLSALGGAGIDVIPLKSGRLASSSRALVEIDLLVRRRDVAAASGVLAAEGLEPEVSLSPEQTGALLFTHGGRRFVHPDRYVVSLQWDVEDRGVVHGPSVEDLWTRASRNGPSREGQLALDRADALLLHCVRGTAKRWHRLAWIRETAELMAEGNPAELDEALARASRCGARLALALGAELASRLLGAPTTARLAEAAKDPSLVELERAVLSDLVAVPRPLPGPLDLARFHVRSRERWRDKVSYALRRATLPGPEDVAALRLPPRLFFLAYALSPLRRAARAAELKIRRKFGYRGKIARFVRTPDHVIDRMLALAGTTPADTVLDIGCGDGAIVIRAAQRLGCRGIGVDIDESLIEAARERADAAGLERLVEFRHGDARKMDLTVPSVVFLYLSSGANLTLRPLLQQGLRRGARLVSFNFDMGDWWPDEVEVLDEGSWGSNTLYLWRLNGAVSTAAPPTLSAAS